MAFDLSPVFQVPSLLEGCAEEGSSSSDEEEDDEDEHESGEEGTQEDSGRDKEQPPDKKVFKVSFPTSRSRSRNENGFMWNVFFLFFFFPLSGKKEIGKRSSEGETKK